MRYMRKTTMHTLEAKIREAQAAGRTALIPYLPYGYPDREAFWKHAAALDAAGADVLEIGVPFSDPVADGPVVENAARAALAGGATLAALLHDLKERTFSCGLVLMGYLNPFLQYGFERLARDAAAAGVSGCIVPDLPLEEAAPFRAALEAEGLALITLVGQNTSVERMRLYAGHSKGYVYVVSVMGTTGGQGSLPVQVRDTLARARSVFSLPLALGFGLREPGQLDGIPEECRPEAAVFGSSLIRHLDAGGTAEDFLHVWRP